MKNPPPSLAEAETALHRASRTLLGHGLFLAACCIAVVVLRRALHLPPQTIIVVLIAALVVFARDIFRWLRCKETFRQAGTDLGPRSNAKGRTKVRPYPINSRQ